MGFRSRLNVFIKHNNISELEFYKNIHVANGYLDNEGAINSDTLCEIFLSYPTINYKWLILGEGEMTGGMVKKNSNH